MNHHKTALVTGANSGIGFEASAQLAAAGFKRVILACRTLETTNIAKSRLIERCGRDIFEVLAVDLAERESVTSACNDMAKRAGTIDFLLLNAAMSSGPRPSRNSDGIELTFASTLIGHHLMTMRLLAGQRLTHRARIVIAGSEAARGDLPGMRMPDFSSFATQHFQGDLEAALEAMARAQPPYQYHWLTAYGIAKSFVVWWVAVLSRKLPPGQTVNAVSPGTTPETNFTRNQSWLMRTLVKRLATLIAVPSGLAGPVSVAARRYLEAEAFADDITGRFFASPLGRLVGPLMTQQSPQFLDPTIQTACWNVVVRLAGGVDYPE